MHVGAYTWVGDDHNITKAIDGNFQFLTILVDLTLVEVEVMYGPLLTSNDVTMLSRHLIGCFRTYTDPLPCIWMLVHRLGMTITT